MRLPIYSLRTGILSHLTFLIVAAMLLINVVMVKFSERDFIRAKVRSGRLLILAIEQNLGYLLSQKNRRLEKIGSNPQFQRSLNRLFAEGEFSGATIINRKGNPVFTLGNYAWVEERGHSLARGAMEAGIGSVEFSGSIWGVIWLGHRELRISEPLRFEGRPIGAISINASLAPIYKAIRKSEKVILLYVLLDTIILALVGIYLLSRIVVRPIHNLLEMTEEYEGGDIFPLFDEASRNEIAKLSRSLTVMLMRLEENKKQLTAHIASLEEANKELQKAQNEIIRSEKLASVGRLAAGIAHEIGNPIGIILGYLDLLRKGEVTESEREDFLGRIESEITRVNRIIGQLLDFSRSSTRKPEKTHTHEVIIATVNMLKPQPILEDIEVNLELQASSDIIFADPDQLQQVFLNIVMNAADALARKDPEGASAPEKVLTVRSTNADNSVELRFIDNGPGIPDEELVHILDPFYTTKEPGKGTGLGLSVCYRIVEGLGGSIRAESALGEGTTIILTLPLFEKEKGE